MARVTVFTGGNVERTGPTNTRVKASDFSISAVGAGLQAAGEGLSKAVDRFDQVEDVKARVEAERLAVEHGELTRQIGQRVKQTLGEGADAAAIAGAANLEKGTKSILGRASPRAQRFIENDLIQRTGIAKDSFFDHGFGETVKAFESTSIARISTTVEHAADEPDEAKARALLTPIEGINKRRAAFFGRGTEWELEENRRTASGFFKSRAMKIATGPRASASAAIEYATKNREFLSDDDYNSVLSAYHAPAIKELALAIRAGQATPAATVVTRAANDDGPSQSRFLDPKQFFKAFTVPHEGSTYVVDSNGAGVKYGINAAYNPGVDVKNLTEADAAKIFEQRYFKRSGADKLPPALAAVHVDTFYLNEKQATRFLKESGGDADKYIELRRSFLNGLVAGNPTKFGKYKRGWENRTQALADFAARQGTDGTPLRVTADTSLTEARAAIMSRTDIGMALKTELVAGLEADRADARAERAIVEDTADRSLTQAALQLGDKFTDIKQLPQDAWLRASPTTRQSFLNQAKGNVENKPLSLDVQRDIGYLRTFKPESLADPKVQAQLRNRGVPIKVLGQLAEEGGNALGRRDSAKPDPIARGVLESLARPHFEAAGVRLWTQETAGGEKDAPKRAIEVQEDARQQLQVMGFLSEAAQNWALNNPGKQADEATMKKWIGTALIKTTHGRPIGTLNDDELTRRIPKEDMTQIRGALVRMGLPLTPQNAAQLYRRRLVYLNARAR